MSRPGRPADASTFRRVARPLSGWLFPALAIGVVLCLIAPASGSVVGPAAKTVLKAPFSGGFFRTYSGPFTRGCASASITHAANWSATTGMGTFGVRSAARPCSTPHPGTHNESMGVGGLILYVTVPLASPPAKLHQITVYWRVLAQMAELLTPGNCTIQPGTGQTCVQEAYIDVFSSIQLQDTTTGASLSTGQMLQFWRATFHTMDCTRGPCFLDSGIAGRGHLGDFQSTLTTNATLNVSHTYELEVAVNGIAGTLFYTIAAVLSGGHAEAVFNPAKVGGVVLRSIAVS